ncbi:MAG: type III PLP-dependent enzyme [Gammaproteobacteria bacterium]
MALAWFESVDEVIRTLRPEEPVYCFDRGALVDKARNFLTAFPGRVLYAVKCNPHPAILATLWDAGLRDFDVASRAEIAEVARRLPGAGLHFMHPVKSRGAIAEAVDGHGIRTFVVDHPDEFAKLTSRVPARETLVLVRFATADAHTSVYDLSSKFGCTVTDAAFLLREIARAGLRPGLAFHVGSQCREPAAFARAIARADSIATEAGIAPVVLDVGGGFPVAYAAPVPALNAYVDAIQAAVAGSRALRAAALWCEPGRGLVAECMSLLVQVWLRRDDRLYLNDGIFGSLAEMFLSPLRMPIRRVGRDSTAPPAPFHLYGPTCDSVDQVPGTFDLPGDVREGDWLEVLHLGAYAQVLASRFNGFHPARVVEIGNARRAHSTVRATTAAR